MERLLPPPALLRRAERGAAGTRETLAGSHYPAAAGGRASDALAVCRCLNPVPAATGAAGGTLQLESGHLRS